VTMLYLCIAFAIIVPYLICSINPAIIAAKIKSGKDIREMGSGNPGLTNTLRTMGKSVAAVVLLFDVLKGVVSILAIVWLFHAAPPFPLCRCIEGCREAQANNDYYQYFCMWLGTLSAVLGHCFPLYYKFRGGKAILVTVATLYVIDWLAATVLLSLFIIIVAVSKKVSLGSLIAGTLYPMGVYLIGTYVWKNSDITVGTAFSSVIAIVLIIKHKENIKRLIAGNEKKLDDKEQR